MKVAFFATSCLCTLFCSGQSDSTIYLDEVEVLGIPLVKYSAGTTIKSIPLEDLGGLNELASRSAINFKSYGNGQLATISLRGTSASHTNVLWNGLQVNSPTLGQTDFSVWPTFLNDEVIVQKGSSSSLFGSGSIGGSIILENSRIRKDSLATFKLGFGSFGNANIGFKTQQRPANNWILETRVFGSRIENDFPYEFNRQKVRQPNARVERLGLSQKVSAELGRHHLFSEVAYSSNNRQIQPTVTSTSRDNLFTKNLRGVITDEVFVENVGLYSSLGFVGGATIYNDTSTTSSQQYSANFIVDVPISNQISSKTGGTYMFTTGRSENYSGDEYDHQYHLFSSFNFSISENVRFTLNVREAIHESKAVFVPSLGGEWSLGSQGTRLKLKGQISRGYRVPTFNDRFWRPGGNPDLLPELSLNREIGVDFDLEKNHNFSVTTFKSNVDQWIQWQPIDGIWTPRNIRKVKVRGVEFSSSSQIFRGKHLTIRLDNEYEYTRSSDEDLDAENQLPYIPRHALSSTLGFDLNSNSLLIRSNYTGERFVNLSNSPQNSIDDFLLIDLVISKVFEALTKSIGLSFSANNVFDTSYESLKNTAMPGRNFFIQLTIKH